MKRRFKHTHERTLTTTVRTYLLIQCPAMKKFISSHAARINLTESLVAIFLVFVSVGHVAGSNCKLRKWTNDWEVLYLRCVLFRREYWADYRECNFYHSKEQKNSIWRIWEVSLSTFPPSIQLCAEIKNDRPMIIILWSNCIRFYFGFIIWSNRVSFVKYIWYYFYYCERFNW